MKTETAISHIRSASREMVRELGLLDNRFSMIGSTSQCHALVELDTQGIMTLNQLSDALNLDKSTTSRLISQLIEKGVCKFQQDDSDRRNKFISLTKKGIELANKIHNEAHQQVKLAIDLMDENEKEIAVQGLSLYAKFLKRSRLQKEFSIRKLAKKDIPALITLIKTVRSEFGFDANHPSSSTSENEYSTLYESFSAPNSQYFVLIHQNKIMGGAGYGPLANHHEICELKSMYLYPSYRGLGLGSLLLDKIQDEILKQSFDQCYLETQDFMQGANTLYKKYGFEQLNYPIDDTKQRWTNSWYIKTFNNRGKSMSQAVEKLDILLKNHRADYTILQDNYRFATAEDGAKHYGISLQETTPTLILKTKDKFYAAIICGNTRISFKKLKQQLGINDISMADPETVLTVTSAKIGEVSLINPELITLIDNKVLSNEHCHGGTGVSKATLRIATTDLVNITQARMLDFTDVKAVSPATQ